MEALERKLPWPGGRPVEGEELAFEYLLNALRLPAGFSLAHFAARTGLDPAVIATPLAEARRRGLLQGCERGALRPTALGSRFLNDLQALFLP